MPLKVAIRRCATSSECGCAGKRKLGYLYLGAAELGARAFRNAAKPRIQRRSKPRRAYPDSPTTFRTHEMSWASPLFNHVSSKTYKRIQKTVHEEVAQYML